jgi:hypothetical protein
MRHITTIKMERLETSRYWRCKPQKDPIVADERVEPFLPRSPTSLKKVYLSITLVGKINCDSRKKIDI